MPNLEKERLSLWSIGETPGYGNAPAMVEYLQSIPQVSISMNRENKFVRAG